MTKILDCDQKCAFLSFKLNKNVFAVSVKKVLEVLEKQEITIVPNAPDYISGVLNFRGEILTIIDLRKKFRFKIVDDSKYVIIVLEIQFGDTKVLTGAIADGVVDVITIESSEVKQVPEMGSHFNTEFLVGMFKRENEIVTILNIDRVFEKHELEMVNSLQEDSNIN